MIGDDHDARSRDRVLFIKLPKYAAPPRAPLVVFPSVIKHEKPTRNSQATPRVPGEIGKLYRYIGAVSMKTQHCAITQSG